MAFQSKISDNDSPFALTMGLLRDSRFHRNEARFMVVYIRSAILAACIFGLLAPSMALAQEEEPAMQIPKSKTPAPSVKPMIFTVIYLTVLMALAAALTIALVLAYRMDKIAGSTVCFIVGAVLVISPVFGIVGSSAVQLVIMATTPENDGAPKPGVIANDMRSALPLAVFSIATFVAFPVGILAIVAAFFFKKPAP
jgi:hypothetical protein